MGSCQNLHEFFERWGRRALGSTASVLLLFTFLYSQKGNAAPIVYKLMIMPFPSPNPFINSFGASGRLGTMSFGGSNNEVVLTLTFEADTANVVGFCLACPSATNVFGYENLVGAASVKITDAGSGAVLAQANFLPSARIFVSVDNSNFGIGFGSFAVADQGSPNFPGEPVYPYGLFPADPLGSGLDTYDLTNNFSVAADPYNFALSCVGFPPPPGVVCGTPKALPTSAGNLYLNPACCVFSLPNAAFSAQIESLTAFSVFTAKAEISGTPLTSFEIKGSFTLGSGSDGINPLAEVVTLQVGASSFAIPSGSFIRNSKGVYVYAGTIAGVALEMRMAPVGPNSYSFNAEGNGANLAETSNPLTVGLTIWDDAGTTTVAPENGSD